MTTALMDSPVKPGRILVIDDNDAIHNDFEKILTTIEAADEDFRSMEAELFGTEEATKQVANYHIEYASQGKQGLDLLTKAMDRNEPFDLAFVDMRMPPGWNGVETIEQLWKVDGDLQVVICTAYSDYSWEDMQARLGLSDRLLILKKPFDNAEVLQMATSLFEKRKMLRQIRNQNSWLESRVAAQTAELKVAQEDAEQLLKSISCILVGLDSNGHVTRWNPIAESFFGISAAETGTMKFMEMAINWRDSAAVTRLLALDAAPSENHLEIELTDKFGIVRTLRLSAFPVVQNAGPPGRLILGSEITETKLLRVQLDQAQRLESVGQLAAGVAHEINTPMQYIGDNVGYVSKCFDNLVPALELIPFVIEHLKGQSSKPIAVDEWEAHMTRAKLSTAIKNVPAALADAQTGIAAVTKIVAAMKEFSHPGSETKMSADLNHILNSALTVAKNEYKYVADVETEFDPQLPIVPGFPSELNQVFLNIIVNAAHAIADQTKQGTESRGLIRLTTSTVEDGIEIQIQDTGGGMPADVQARIFEPFFTTKAVGKGTGQGLAIAYSVIVNKHQGRIWCEVNPGVGTTFVVQLPCESLLPENEIQPAVATHDLTSCATD